MGIDIGITSAFIYPNLMNTFNLFFVVLVKWWTDDTYYVLFIGMSGFKVEIDSNVIKVGLQEYKK